MKQLVLLIPAILLTGCLGTTAPVIAKFPDANQSLMQACPDLKSVAADNKDISEILNTVTDNYKEYYECQAKVNDWIFWYTEQKKNWDKVK